MKNKMPVLLICAVSLIMGGCSSASEPGADLEGIDKELFDIAVSIEDESAKSTIELGSAIAFNEDDSNHILITYNIFYDNGALDSKVFLFYRSKKDESDEYNSSDYTGANASGSWSAQLMNITLEQYMLEIEMMINEGKILTYDEYIDYEDGVISPNVDTVNEELIKYQEQDK